MLVADLLGVHPRRQPPERYLRDLDIQRQQPVAIEEHQQCRQKPLQQLDILSSDRHHALVGVGLVPVQVGHHREHAVGAVLERLGHVVSDADNPDIRRMLYYLEPMFALPSIKYTPTEWRPPSEILTTFFLMFWDFEFVAPGRPDRTKTSAARAESGVLAALHTP